MAVYLIDYENVRSEGLRGIVSLQAEDKVYLFYSGNADSLTFEAHDWIMESKAQIQKYKIVRGGKNALDFQLSSFLGYLIHETENGSFYIISRDKGFYYVMDFWTYLCKEHHATLICGPSIEEAMKRKSYAEYRGLTEYNDEVMEHGTYETDEASQEGLSSEVMVMEMVSAVPYSTEADELKCDPVPEAALVEQETEKIQMTKTETAKIETAKTELVKIEMATTGEGIKPEEAEAEKVNQAAVVQSEAASAESVESKKRNPRSRAKKREAAVDTVAATLVFDEARSSEADSEKSKNASEATAESSAEAEVSATVTKIPRQRKNTRRKKNSGKEEAAVNAAVDTDATATSDVSSAVGVFEQKKTETVSADVEKLLKERIGTLIKGSEFSEPIDEAACASKTATFIIEANDKQDFYRRIVKVMGQKPGLEIYKMLRAEYNNLKQLV